MLNLVGQQLNAATVLLATEMLKAFDQVDQAPREYREEVSKAIDAAPLVAAK